ncbi:MAG: hypothetical protein AAF485_13450 [Chloroflexota bacterium]
MNTPTLEVVTFKLNESVAEDEFMQRARGLESWLQQIDGFIKRELSKNEEGLWIDILHWRSLSEALSAAEQIMAAPEGQAFGSLIDPESINMMHVKSHYTFSSV